MAVPAGDPEADAVTVAVSRTHERTPGARELAAAAEVFALLSDPTRLHLLWLLTHGEADVSALTEACGAARPAVSQHLAKLRLGGLVQSRKDGRRVVYAMPDGHLKRLVVEAISRADHVVSGEPWHD
ncbi:winged helix-turn-helix transcriptional regulator [Streptomyces gardneri]|uniref:ArsR/SmtB family transcription factor n=1 Tax=Streptomyces gardneri TaxID=66892 RepID=UPI0006E3F5C9|nr:metalloregulator ArsR/SmtB family transcription factor [Streptomyces gardneri]QPK50803.1 winged helix-turn-helix transcriptional regulator [Streptomyces gardneri]WRK42173.1 metalloregulator ArsR/SmtB family transcription factor [Streptomyces venezuelae]